MKEERKDNRRSDELLETNGQFINDKSRKVRDGADPEKIGRVDLDSPMPHYIDEI